MRSMPAFSVMVDMGQPLHAPTSSMSTTPVAASTLITFRSPPSAWRAGRMTSTASSTCACMGEVSREVVRIANSVAVSGHVGAEGLELAGQVLVAAVDVVGVGHGGLAVGGEAGHDQGGAGPDVPRLHRRAAQPRHPPHDRMVALGADVGAHAQQLGHIAEPAAEQV